MHRLLKPYAREQLFRDLLQGRALPVGSSTRQLLEELGGEGRSVLLLDFRIKCGFDSLERYVVGNMLGDLLPDGTRFSGYLEHARITMAQRLLEFEPEMKISRLAELAGHPLDGQYFSKVFRKICGVTPTEYRNKC